MNRLHDHHVPSRRRRRSIAGPTSWTGDAPGRAAQRAEEKLPALERVSTPAGPIPGWAISGVPAEGFARKAQTEWGRRAAQPHRCDHERACRVPATARFRAAKAARWAGDLGATRDDENVAAFPSPVEELLSLLMRRRAPRFRRGGRHLGDAYDTRLAGSTSPAPPAADLGSCVGASAPELVAPADRISRAAQHSAPPWEGSFRSGAAGRFPAARIAGAFGTTSTGGGSRQRRSILSVGLERCPPSPPAPAETSVFNCPYFEPSQRGGHAA